MMGEKWLEFSASAMCNELQGIGTSLRFVFGLHWSWQLGEHGDLKSTAPVT